MDKHPIQIVYVNVSEIDFAGYMIINEMQERSYGVKVGFNHTPYDTEEKCIHLKGRAIIGKKLDEDGDEDASPDNPFYMSLHVVARFEVDEGQFDIAYIEDWAEANAPMLVMPYLREHVSSLAIRCGYPGVSLPLLKVPGYKDDRKIKKEQEAE